MVRSARRWLWAGLIVYVVLFVSWVASPVYRSFRGVCPVRPGPVGEAGAVPGFARKYGVACTQCHTAWPMLNDYGRQFKLNGYVREPDSKEGVIEGQGGYWTEKIFPWGVIVRSRPYDKRNTDNEFRMAAIQDMDFFVAGGDAARHVSWFGELDANNGGAWAASAGDIQLGYHPSQYLNLIAARRSFFVMDPYQNISNFAPMTTAPRAIAGFQPNQGSLSADTLDNNTKQTIMAYGEVDKEGLGGLYYAAGISADKADEGGTGPKDVNVRLAFDTLKGVEVGMFGSAGHEGVSNSANLVGVGDPTLMGTGNKVKYAKAGMDLMVEKNNFVARAAYLYSRDRDELAARNGVPGEAVPVTDQFGHARGLDTTRSAYGELFYIYKRKGDVAPFLIPLIRENWYTTFNGTRSFNYVTAQMSHYFRQNVRGFLEWTGDMKQDIQGTVNLVRSPKNSQWILQLEVGF